MWPAAILLCVVLAGATTVGTLRGASVARLRVALATSAALPAAVGDATAREVARIWRREGIAIDWLSPSEATPGTAAMRVLIVSAGAPSASRDEHHWPVAELVSGYEGRPIAIASLQAAERVLAEAGLGNAPSALVHRHLALILGRAVAHEIGHHVLNTASHARRGLMRARISATEFADRRDGGFDLDEAAATWARARLMGAPAAAPFSGRFAYRP